MSAKPEVLVVLTNWRRPKNLPAIIQAFRIQTVPVEIALIDNSGLPPTDVEFQIAANSLGELWKVNKNLGPPCRFAPALMQHDFPYVLFYDDDCLPGSRAVGYLLEAAEEVKFFSTIGQIGRRFRGELPHLRYIPKNVNSTDQPVAVDMTCRSHFVHARLLHKLLDLKWSLLNNFSRDELDKSGLFYHDDILLCLGIQRATGFPSYITADCDDSRKLFCIEMNDDNAVSSRPSHRQERTNLINLAGGCGWKSLCKTTGEK